MPNWGLLHAAVGLTVALGLAPAAAHAEMQDLLDAVSPSAFAGLLDLRASYADGERAWLDGGFGKTRVSGHDLRLQVGEADLAWQPHFGFAWRAVVEGEYQPDHDRAPHLGEAYVAYKPLLDGRWRAQARAGLMYPPISEEHSGVFWTPTDTITPSAINSWVGEEVKVVGGEAMLSRRIGDQSLEARLGVFGSDQTAGTLLALRGWSLGDVRGNAGGELPLPPRSAFIETVQPPYTVPLLTLTHKAGYYGRIDWQAGSQLSLSAFYYNNEADPTAVNSDDIWGWRTAFWNFSAVYLLDDATRLKAQVMVGDTRMGLATPRIWVNTHFSAGYLMVVHDLGKDGLAARLDVFSTGDRTDQAFGPTQEQGWALTADYRKAIARHVSGLIEVLHVQSDRPARTVIGEPSEQSQTVLQAALRLGF